MKDEVAAAGRTTFVPPPAKAFVPRDLRERTKSFALRVVKFYSVLPKSTEAQVMGRQLLRSGTSPGAQYREACRAKSDADFVSKVEGALQELDESCYWLELLRDSRVAHEEECDTLIAEAGELIAIFVSVTKSVKANRRP
jgi:four helix bundle protein